MLNNGLYIIATPIGNLSDISERAKEILAQADIVACEDTRVSKKLFSLLGLPLKKNFISYQNYTEEDKADALADLIEQGNALALISDAGSPLISDPGYKLVRQCRKRGLKVCAVPGACAVIAALQLSGLPTNRFMFAGFVPNKDKARTDFLKEFQSINATLVFYETALRLTKTLAAAAQIFGSREMAVAREITKIYEDCQNGTAQELEVYFTDHRPKGEIVLVVAPPEKEKPEMPNLKDLLREKLATMSLKEAVSEVTKLSGEKKNVVYALALEVKDEA